MKFNSLPAGFVIPAQPVKARKPPSGADWIHEIKHDGYRMIVRRDGPSVRLYSRNAHDWTARLSAIATAARGTKPGASRLTARRLYWDRMVCRYSRSCPVGRGTGRNARRFLDRKNALARLLRHSEAGILFNEHIAEDGPVVFAHACRLGAEGIVERSKWT
jgi:bifunctional non-homologous end joining protein LigD